MAYYFKMPGNKAAILAKLQKEILPLQGYKTALNNNAVQVVPQAIGQAFPNKEFPLGAVHEFVITSPESSAATDGFMGAITSKIMTNGGACLWFLPRIKIFPPALKSFGIDPEKIIFIELQKERDVLWAMEEALKCQGLSAVIAEMQTLSFIASRRLQLAVEQSRVTGFVLRNNPRSINTTACISRWQISPLPTVAEDELPGVGLPRWKVDLLKVRNGTPGNWIIEYDGEKLRQVIPPSNLKIIPALIRKIG